MRIAVGLDVSKGFSIVAYTREDGKKISKPHKVLHTISQLNLFSDRLKKFDGEVRIVCEETGNYSDPIVHFLQNEGFFVSCVNPVLISSYSQNSLHNKKTDQKDAEKIAEYGIDHWNKLKENQIMEPVREILKVLNHQRDLSVRNKTSFINALISLTDKVYPGVNKLFAKTPKNDREKWIDYLSVFWHPDCLRQLTFEEFCEKFRKFSKDKGYHYSEVKAKFLYDNSFTLVPTLPKIFLTKRTLQKAIKRVRNAISDVAEYDRLLISTAQKLPEFKTVLSMEGVSELLAAQLIAEIGDVSRFRSRKALIAFAGLDPDIKESGKFSRNSNPSTKRGNKFLRNTLFLIMNNLLMRKPDDPVYKFLKKKRSEGKKYKVYMTAGASKFLRIYFGKVNSAMREFRLNEAKAWRQ